ncbi:MAG: hypothetical protein P4M11_15815 [Candidatus Pacebacteria bacterium]|nr:hypothetical protein [Candidatus Paceibacterota bacterium]
MLNLPLVMLHEIYQTSVPAGLGVKNPKDRVHAGPQSQPFAALQVTFLVLRKPRLPLLHVLIVEGEGRIVGPWGCKKAGEAIADTEMGGEDDARRRATFHGGEVLQLSEISARKMSRQSTEIVATRMSVRTESVRCFSKNCVGSLAGKSQASSVFPSLPESEDGGGYERG